MDNPAAVLTDDVADWNPGRRTAAAAATSPPHQYKRNVSAYSLDIPVSMGLMVTANNGTNNTTSGDMKLTEVAANAADAADAAVPRPVANGKRRRKGRGKSKRPGYDPFQMRDKSKATTDSGALLHLIKSSLGSGILAMPNAFKNGGLIFSLVGTAAIGMLCTHCIYLLVLCSQALARRTRRPALGFADTAAAAFKTGPRRFRPWATFAREFVNAALFCTYYFGNTVYVVLVAASFKQVADSHTPPEWHYSVRAWILGLALPLVPLGIIRSLRLLVPFSAIATAFILIGLGCTMSWVVTGASLFAGDGALSAATPLPDISSRPWIAPVGHMPLFFATVLFAMEGIGTVLPIENSMRHPQRFLKSRPCGVLNLAMVLVVCLYSVAGFLGYLRFGDDTDGSITLNLPNDLFAEAVKIMVALSILFSYGLQFCVPSEIVWTRLEPWLRDRGQVARVPPANAISAISGTTTTLSVVTNPSVNEKKQLELELAHGQKPMNGAYYIMRATMILGTVFIAALVPDLAPFISLIGAVFFSILGLMCPAIIHLVAFWDRDDENVNVDDDDDDDDEMDDETDDVMDDETDAETDAETDDFENEGYDYDENDDDAGLQQRRDADRRDRGVAGGGGGDGGRTAATPSGMSRWAVAKDLAIVLIATVALVSGTYASLVDIVAFYGAGGEDGPPRHAVNGTASVATTTIGPGPESAFLRAVLPAN